MSEAKKPNREAIIIRTSIIGILANVFLAAFKTAVGLLSHSIAIVLDAVNNLSDAFSSLVTIIGTKLAGKPADRKHPYGHGRVEYMSALVIAVIVLYAGVTSFVESVKKIIHPALPDYSTVTLVIVAAAVVVKFFLGRYVKKVGQEVDSDSLVNSGEDARLDAVISASTLAAAVLYMTMNISVEAWLGALISLVIIKAGVEMLGETHSRILGQRAEGEVTREIKETVCSVPGVLGAYDLILHDYGPDRTLASVHIEVPDTYTADRIDAMTREIQHKVMEQNHVIITAVGVYSVNTKDDAVQQMYQNIRDTVMAHDHVMQIHGFFADPEKKTIRFDVVIDFMEEDMHGLFDTVRKEVQELYPDYQLHMTLDTDVSD
ncbi:MAG: cation transporter [Solobacterium sp.]|nr:cation transporter [Solobacterium sp.]